MALISIVPSRQWLSIDEHDLRVAGIQAENPSPAAVLENLDHLATRYPDTPLYVLSEYTFDDGLPAAGQRLWFSPWGRIGICICYDLSYRRVTDRLVSLGAQALIVPTMDAESWGAREHTLHARIAPVGASEHGIPVFRVASSGISQAVAGDGRELARAPFPGNAATLSARFALGPIGTLPFDRFLVPVSLFVTAAFLLFLPLRWLWRMVALRSSDIIAARKE